MRASSDWPGRPFPGFKVNTSHLSGKRQWQVKQNAKLAALAREAVLPPDEYGDPTPLGEDAPYRSPKDFVEWALRGWLGSGSGVYAPVTHDDDEGLLVDLDAAMESRFYEVAMPQEARLSPLPGDVVVFHDNHMAICVKAQCSGCRNFGVVEFSSTKAMDAGIPPTIRETNAWITNVRLILRPVVAKKKADAGAAEAGAGAGAGTTGLPVDEAGAAAGAGTAGGKVAPKRKSKKNGSTN